MVFCHICLNDKPTKRHLRLNLCKDCYDKVIQKNENNGSEHDGS